MIAAGTEYTCPTQYFVRGNLMHPFSPEGLVAVPPDPETLRRGIPTGEIFRAMCIKCDEHHNLHVDLGPIRGIIPREETVPGLAEGRVREIAVLSRVGKPVSFQVLDFNREGSAILSRRAAQLEARNYFLNALCPGDVIPAKVQTTADFGVFCDIGCGFTALMHLSRCCISRLKSGSELYHPGQDIYAAVLSIQDSEGRIHLTGRELLGTWEENADGYRQGQTVPGIVRSIMPYGAFVELAPNLSGLAEPVAGLRPGQAVSVFIRGILREKHKIKLNILEVLPQAPTAQPLNFRITRGHLDKWEYFPGSAAVTYF